MDRLHEKIQSDGIRLMFSRHFSGMFRLITSQGLITRGRELRLDKLTRRRIVLNDKNPWGFSRSGYRYGCLGSRIRRGCKEGQGKMEASSIAGLALDLQFTPV